MAGGDFKGAAEAVEDGSGPAEVGGDAGGDFVPTGAGGGAEAVGVGDDLAGGEVNFTVAVVAPVSRVR